MSGNWFDWLGSGPGGSGGMQQQMQTALQQQQQMQQQQAQQNYAQQQALAQTQQTGYLPAEQWGQQQMAPLPQMQQGMPGGGMMPGGMGAIQNLLRGGMGAPGGGSLMGQLSAGLGQQQQQRLPDYSGGGPNTSPYAMPGTVRYNPGGM